MAAVPSGTGFRILAAVMRRRRLEWSEDLRWAIVMAFVAVSAADPLVQRLCEGVYRVGWWIRRRADRLRGRLVDGATFAGNLYVRTSGWTALRYKRLRRTR